MISDRGGGGGGEKNFFTFSRMGCKILKFPFFIPGYTCVELFGKATLPSA